MRLIKILANTKSHIKEILLVTSEIGKKRKKRGFNEVKLQNKKKKLLETEKQK